MGTWGTSISSNDTYADVYGQFFDLYHDGLEVKDISKQLIESNQDTINDPEDSNNFWFALAKAEWECKQLDPPLYEKVKQIIETGVDIVVWQTLGAEEKDITKRKASLSKFLADISTERPKARARKKKIIRQPVFAKGDCLSFKLNNGNYGGAVVLEADNESGVGYNLIATTRINQINKPTKADFEKAHILILNFANHNNRPSINWIRPTKYKEVAHLFDKIDNIEVKCIYSSKEYTYGFCFDLVGWIIGVANLQFEHEKNVNKPNMVITVKELTGKKSFRFW